MIRKICIIVALAVCSTLILTAHAAEKPKPKKTIGVSLLAATNPFFVDMGNAIKAEAAKHGMDVVLTSAEFDVAKQKNQVSDFIVNRASAIILCPADSKAIGTSIAEASKAGIPVFTADIAALAEKDKVICHVATDNLGGGREAGRAMITALDGNGKVAVLDHPEVESVILRTRGFRQVIDEHNSSGKGKIEIVA